LLRAVKKDYSTNKKEMEMTETKKNESDDYQKIWDAYVEENEFSPVVFLRQ